MVETNGNGSPSDTENKWVKEFKTCPVCGSGNRMFEQMGQELKDRGLAPADGRFCFDVRTGPFGSQNILNKLPIGGQVPAFTTDTDFCVDCGCLYAVRLERCNATKNLAPVPLMTPGNGFRLPGQNNPLRN